jgi:hypothetical protein
MDWSQRRKILYAAGVAGALVLLASYPLYKVIYKAPTCSDQKQNGTEAGIDCGGICSRACVSQTKPLRVLWAKAFATASGKYDVGAYVENPNLEVGIKTLHYTLRIKDKDGRVLGERVRVTEIPPAASVLLFESNFAFTGIPERVDVEWNPADLAVWTKAQTMSTNIITKNQSLKNTDTTPRFDATLVNTDLVNSVGQVDVGAIIYDSARNPVAVSSTVVYDIPKGGEQNIFFTWPSRFTKIPRGGACPSPVDTMLLVDRSGSMDIGRQNPPEPLTTIKNALNTYVNRAALIDKLGVVSFATTVSIPLDQELSVDHEKVAQSIQDINVLKGSVQDTDIGDAIKTATVEFQSSRHAGDAKKVAILLTDGVPNRPLDPANKNRIYAQEDASDTAASARSAGVEIYAIGLGSGVNEAFLRDKIASDVHHYFSAVAPEDLQGIYTNIAGSVCKKEGTDLPTENFITEIVMTPHAVFAE